MHTNSTRARWLLVLLTLATLACRLWGIHATLPYYKEADAHIPLHVELIRHGFQEPDPRHNDIQYPIVLAGAISLLPDTQPAPESVRTLDEHLAAAAHVYVETRIVVAFLATLLVPLTFMLARRFVGERWALFAALLIAVSLLHQCFAQEARPHGAVATIFLVAVMASMRLARKASAVHYVVAVLCAAISIGTLHSGLAVMVPLVVAAFIALLVSAHQSSGVVLTKLALVPLFALGIPVVSVCAFYPFLFRSEERAEYGKPHFGDWKLVLGDHTIDLRDFLGQGFVNVGRTFAFYEPVLMVLLALALAMWLLGRKGKRTAEGQWFERSDYAVALSFVLPYVVLIGLFRYTYERFQLPLMPFYATFAAWGVAQLASKLSVASSRKVVIAAAVVVQALPAYACARLAWLRAGDSTLELAARAVTAQAKADVDRVYITPSIDLPLARTHESLFPSDPKRPPNRNISRWSVYQFRMQGALPAPLYDVRYLVPRPDIGYPAGKIVDDPDGYVRALGPGWYVVDVSKMPGRAGTDAVIDAVRKAGKLVARFGPTDDAATRDWGLYYEDELLDDWPNVFCRVLRAHAFGPVVEVYRVQ